MSEIRTSDDVRDALVEGDRLNGPLANWTAYQALASEVLGQLNGGRQLTAAEVDRLVDYAAQGSKKKETGRKRVTRLLEAGNQCGIWESPLPSRPIVKPRPSVAPMSANQERQRRGAINLERYFRKQYLKPGLTSETALLGTALLLVTRLGVAEPVLYGMLTNLRRADFDQKTGWISTPSHPAVDREATYRLRLPEPLVGLLRWQRRSVPRRIGVWFFAGSLSNGTDDDLPDAEEVRQCLAESYKRLVKDYKSDGGQGDSLLPRTLSEFVGAGRHRARELGLAPQFLTLVGGYPLPVSPSAIALLEDEPVRTRCWQPSDPEPQKPILASAVEDKAIDVPSTLPNDFDWIGFVHSEIEAFFCQLGPFCALAGGVKRGFKNDVFDLLDHFNARALSVLRTPSILRVLPSFAVSKLEKDGVKFASVRDTVRHLCDQELLAEPACLDLSSWDEETVFELTELFTSQRDRRAVATRQARLLAWVGLLNFASEENFASIPSVSPQGLMTLPAGRAEILTPDDAERLHWRLRELDGVTERERLMLGAAFSLGMHAGLRASEVINITLQNVVVEGERAYLYIPRGKTPASRRRLWLHALMPRREVALFIDLVQTRSSERPAACSLNQFYLFGYEQSASPIGRRLLIDKLIPAISAFLGRTVDFHLLRHSFCSWLVARAYLIENPGIGDRLHGLDEELKEPRGLRALAEYLRYPLPANHHNAGMQHDIWQRIARVMGHSSPLTLTTTYAHTLGAIHSVMLEQTSVWARRERL